MSKKIYNLQGRFFKKSERQNEDLRLTKWSMNLLSKTSNTSRLTSNLGF